MKKIIIVALSFICLQINGQFTNDDDIIERSQSERNDNIKWTLEIYNASTAERQYAKEISCSACDVDISDLKKGLYIIRALIGDEILNEKITIQ